MSTEVKTVQIDYKTVVNLVLVEGKGANEVAEYFGITFKEAVEAIRAYGFTVKKDEKEPVIEKAYEIVYTNPEKIVVKKEKPAKAEVNHPAATNNGSGLTTNYPPAPVVSGPIQQEVNGVPVVKASEVV